ncbi:MAG: tRNA (adenosine(37)-N6)-threonylcarbamoyltransferase complex ATPase subunit type 1 TsaE [Fibrobacteraceae bacterium]|nr:tRNA (adenosine(37)-N6)-threonylcarbamoyltransferase complex ATPase subunit type 1 TsaE [Fibrobacteraceae bacterium]
MTKFVKTIEIITHSEKETFEWAENFGKSLKKGSVVALYGTLGAGKTVICRGICKGLGYSGQVNSPTYTIVHEYPNAELPLFHLDLYRLPPHADLNEIGVDYYMSSEGVTLIEWPERLEEETASITHRLNIEIIEEDSRKISVETISKAENPS